MCNHNWRFINDAFQRDNDNWLRGPAKCTKCESSVYLWFMPGKPASALVPLSKPFSNGIVIVRNRQESKVNNV